MLIGPKVIVATATHPEDPALRAKAYQKNSSVKIGNNVLIAPNAFVNFDVPDNSIVIGNPGQIIIRDSSPSAKYIVYSVNDYYN